LTNFSYWTGARQKLQKRNMPIAAIFCAMLVPAGTAEASGVSGVQVEDRQIVIRFDGIVEKASTLLLAGPDRIAVDVSGADPGGKSETAGLVAGIRQGRFDSNTARIVFDLASPAIISGGSFAADGRSLTLSIAPASSGQFQTGVISSRKLYLPPEANRAAPPRSRYNITIPLDAPSNGLPRPRIYGPKGRPLVVIDAGHGGHDPGAISPMNSTREKDITLRVARAIRDELIAAGRVRVALTREDDRFLVLRERSAIARNLGAELFISIHADSAAGIESAANGATVYTLSEVASDREAAKLAQRENKADIINGVNLGGENAEIASILVDLAQRESMNSSANFARLLKRESSSSLNLRADYHRMADLAVLKSPDMASILLEVGYVTNTADLDRLGSATGQKQIASGLRKAIDIHFAKQSASR
jgi:N-acetylmuramoyl-L-alanine amidase